jgi:hypothetical protein
MKIFVNKEQATQRYEICKNCNQLNNIVKICNVCNCFMPAKVTLSSSYCPKSKWGVIDADETIIEKYHILTDIKKIDPIVSSNPPKFRLDHSQLQHGDLWINISNDVPSLNEYDIETNSWKLVS